MMIGVTCAQGIFWFLALMLLGIAVCYLRAARRREQPQWRRVDSHHLFSCDNCHYTFLNKDLVNLTRCPRCNAICIRRRVR